MKNPLLVPPWKDLENCIMRITSDQNDEIIKLRQKDFFLCQHLIGFSKLEKMPDKVIVEYPIETWQRIFQHCYPAINL